MTDDLYPRPNRGAIAARVLASMPGANAEAEETPVPASHYCDSGNCSVCGDGTGDKPETPDVMARYATHLRARLRALGWTQGELEERAGVSAPTIARAVNGTNVSLDIAAKLASVVGSTLITMIGEYTCGTCQGSPYPGYRCLECGEEGERQ